MAQSARNSSQACAVTPTNAIRADLTGKASGHILSLNFLCHQHYANLHREYRPFDRGSVNLARSPRTNYDQTDFQRSPPVLAGALCGFTAG